MRRPPPPPDAAVGSPRRSLAAILGEGGAGMRAVPAPCRGLWRPLEKLVGGHECQHDRSCFGLDAVLAFLLSKGCSFIPTSASSLLARGGPSKDTQAKMDFISLKTSLKPCMTTKDTVRVGGKKGFITPQQTQQMRLPFRARRASQFTFQ